MDLPPLFIAAQEGRADDVRELLRQGADSNERVKAADDYGAFFEGVTPLMVAAASRLSNAETVAALLEGGADPFAVSDGEVTALWYAAGGGTGHRTDDWGDDHPLRLWGGGDVERLRLLLDAGLPAQEAADNGRTALGEACSLGDPARVALLIERGASVWPVPASARDMGDDTELAGPLLQVMKQMQELTDAMGVAPGCASDPDPYEAMTVPLFLAAESGSLECVKLVVDQGFPADFYCEGQNALTSAKTLEIAEYLLDLGLEVKGGRFGFDAIDDAFEENRFGVAFALLRRIQNPAERQAVIEQKLLMCSGVHMNPEAIRLLIAEGAHVNRLDKDYGSPLHYACWQGDGNGGREDEVTEGALRALLDAGADPNLKAKGGYPLHEAVHGDWGSPIAVRLLLEYGAEVDARDENGQTPLMVAADHGELECIWLLLQAGADPRPAIPLAKEHLKIWEGLASEKPLSIGRFLKKFEMNFISVEESIANRKDALERARRAMEVLEAAAAN